MKNKKKWLIALGIVLFIVGIVVCMIGVFSNFSGEKKKTLQTSEKKLTKISGNVIFNIVDNLREEHCFKQLCINDMDNNYEKGSFGVINGTFINKGDERIEKKVIKLTFILENDTKELFLYAGPLEPQSSNYFENHHRIPELVEAIDYIIEEATEKEAVEFEKSLVR